MKNYRISSFINEKDIVPEKKHKLLKLTQENIETFNRPTTNKEIELVIKILPTKISVDPDRASQVNSTKHLKQNE